MGLWEALTKGEGTPWGPAATGRPDLPNLDINSYQGMDTSPMLAAGKARIAGQGAKAREQALARLRASGVRGADTGAALANVAEGQANAMGNLESQLAMLDWQAKQANAGNAWRKYEADLMANAAENRGRGNFWDALSQVAGTVLGGALGGPAGAAAGGTIGKKIAGG